MPLGFVFRPNDPLAETFRRFIKASFSSENLYMLLRRRYTQQPRYTTSELLRAPMSSEPQGLHSFQSIFAIIGLLVVVSVAILCWECILSFHPSLGSQACAHQQRTELPAEYRQVRLAHECSLVHAVKSARMF